VATETSVTQTGQVLGTAAYISPEQARGETATAASDRYALAVVAFELLTGRRPFDADHPSAQARAHVEAAVPSASEGTGLPASVDRVLRAGMAKDPERRPATATELLDRLEDALEGGVAPPEPPTTVVAPPPAAPRRRWPGMVALAALALVAGSAIAIATGAGKGDGGGSTTPTTAASRSAGGEGAGKTGATTGNRGGSSTATQPRTTTTQPPATSTQQTTPPARSSDPVALNNAGFALIQQGRPTAAVPSLQRSVEAFRAQGRTSEIDYAYALYNLGNALRLSGRPADAIPYLEERLRISDYKRGVVKQELKTARRLASD
jgi:eukaryotic-like serine/threonine-protein kinase